MTSKFTLAAGAALACGAFALDGVAGAADTPSAEFADPVRLTAGWDAFESTLYPSPVLFDADGNGKPDLVVGDLFGRLRASRVKTDESDVQWSATVPMESGGKPLKLNNW